jgi:2,3-bisphosphoglycerate-independent phosphoglycerate mutase
MPRVGLGRTVLELRPLAPERGEGVLAVTGGADDRVTDSDPFFRARHPVLRPLPLVPEAAATARAAELWSRLAIRALARHPINVARARRGAPALAAVALKWWGRRRPAPSFRARHGLDGVIVGDSPFLAGLATTIGLRYRRSPEGEDPAAAMRDRLAAAREALDAGADFVLCHLKATDEAGHTKDPAVKRRTIEAVDGALGDLGGRFAETVICVTGDHATPTDPEVIHSGDPVPFLLCGPGVRADRVERFGEIDLAAGILGRLDGSDVMPLLLNAADRPLFLGSRPTAAPAPAGAPADVEPLSP